MAIAQTAADVVHREVVERKNPDYALKALSMASSALGLGARKEEVHRNTYVAVLPAKAGSSKQWWTIRAGRRDRPRGGSRRLG